MFKDIVCGMDVDEKSAAGKSEFQGKIYFFCSPGCKRAFDKNPRQYLLDQMSRAAKRDEGKGEAQH